MHLPRPDPDRRVLSWLLLLKTVGEGGTQGKREEGEGRTGEEGGRGELVHRYFVPCRAIQCCAALCCAATNAD